MLVYYSQQNDHCTMTKPQKCSLPSLVLQGALPNHTNDNECHMKPAGSNPTHAAMIKVPFVTNTCRSFVWIGVVNRTVCDIVVVVDSKPSVNTPRKLGFYKGQCSCA